MNNLTTTILEAIGIGILTLIIGRVMFYSAVDKSKREEVETYDHNLSLTLFMIGFVLHLLMEYGGLNKLYCNKECACGLKSLSKL